MARRASPGIGRAGHNSSLPTHANIRSALAIEMIFEEEAKKLRERHKRARKRIEGMGVRLDDLKFMKGLDGKTGSEVIDEFKRQWHVVGAIYEDQYEQLDIFAPKPAAPEVRAAHFTMGLLKGLRGEDADIPPAVVGDDRQQFIDGHNEGMARRQAAWESIADSDTDKPVDGTGTTPSVVDKAAKDFAKDHGDDPLVVSGVTYPNMRQANAARKRLEAGPQVVVDNTAVAREAVPAADAGELRIPVEHDVAMVVDETSERYAQSLATAPRVPVMKPAFDGWSTSWELWTGAQTMEFRRWVESMPADFVPLTTHVGAVAYFRLLREEQANRALDEDALDEDGERGEVAVADAFDEDAEFEDVAPKAQAADLPDPADIEAGAKALVESGFAPPKRGRKPKNLAK